MIRAVRYIILFLLLLNRNQVQSQRITGTWEGRMGQEWLQINIKENNGILCGYTYDRFINDEKDHCKVYFTGEYNFSKKVWVITGQSFIENSGSHVFMRIWLWRESSGNNNFLAANITTEFSSEIEWPEDLLQHTVLKKVLRNPRPLDGKPLCLPEPVKPKLPVEKKQPLIPATIITDTTKANVIQSPDTNQHRKDIAVITHKDTPVLQKMIARKRTGISRLEVNVKQITLAVYDNGIIDGDTVSIFFNGKLLVNKQLLSAKPLIINLDLNENISVNEIVMYAENLGTIPPNTALIVVTAGDKRYELFSSASLEENAVLVFDYKPK